MAMKFITYLVIFVGPTTKKDMGSHLATISKLIVWDGPVDL